MNEYKEVNEIQRMKAIKVEVQDVHILHEAQDVRKDTGSDGISIGLPKE